MPNANEGKDRLISLAEASELYGFNADYLRQLILKGRLNAQKIGKFWVTTPTDVERYIRSRKRMGAFRDDIKPLDD